jgi:curved DNA-binding protein CbpA
MNPYDTLGIPRTATDAEVKSAYRRRAVETHPDKAEPGTDCAARADEFRRVQAAYEVLSDPARRARFDATGDDGRTEVPAARAIAIRAFLDAMHDPKINVSGRNFLQHAVHILRGKAKKTTTNLGHAEHNLKGYRDTLRRLARKAGTRPGALDDDPLRAALEDQIAITAAAEAELKVWLARIREAGQILETYQFADPATLFLT